MPGTLRVAYLVSQYPAPSHAFIEREILGLRRLGVEVETFSVRPTAASDLLDEEMRREASRTTVVQGDALGAARDLWRTMCSAPRGVARVGARAARTGESTLRGRVWQLFYLAEATRVLHEMRERGLRHVHAHFANNAADIARLVVALGAAADGPDGRWSWSFSMHGPVEFEAVARYDLAQKVRDSAGVACISDFARSQMMKLVEPDQWSKLSVVRMSVDLDRYSAAGSASSSAKGLRILAVGRLVAEKGWPVLLDAFAALARRRPDVELAVVGDGELRLSLERQVADLRLRSQVRFLGALGQDRLPDIYRNADIFCLPSFQEGLPVVLMEAMASGLPVVTTPIAGIPELVENDVTGVLVPPGRSDLLADALDRLAGDPAARQRMVVAGRDRVGRMHSSDVSAVAQRAFLELVCGR